ncbi:MAG: DNA-processing protein DprA, partial [Clostridia bacterium]|nr:DNA-processing protein DprA [Clostridia bacterium]
LEAILVDSNKLESNLTEYKDEILQIVDDKQYTLLKKQAKLGVDLAVEQATDGGIRCVTYYSEAYPQKLKDIYDPPLTLFCKGNVSLLCQPSLAVVGTRKISAYGKRVTENFTYALAHYFCIVSGLAYGVDAIAHETTLSAQGKTIAVLGGGLNKIYPSQHTWLADKIVQKDGLLVSEYPPQASSLAYHFPQRNRIVSALSNGVLVCAAPLKSGTFSTVEFALEQGKDVFVVPGEIYDYAYLGSNKLIASMQGAMVTSPDDVLNTYGKVFVQEKSSIQLDINEQMIVNLLESKKLHFNDIAQQTQIDCAQLNVLLANLQLCGIVEKLAGNFYQLWRK